MLLCVLGRFQVQTLDGKVRTPAPMAAKVGTMLVGWPGRHVERERLITALWGDSPPAGAVNTLQAHVSTLRRLLGASAVVGEPTGYLLDVPRGHIDAEIFVHELRQATASFRVGDYARALALLDHALGLWRGEPYCDVSDPELAAHAVRLTELREVAMEDRLLCHLALARDEHDARDLVAAARELVALAPLRERRHELLINALAAAGEIGEANVVYAQAAERLQAHTGQPVGPQLTALIDALNDPDTDPPAALQLTASGR